MGCHFLLQRIFPTQGLNPGLLHCRQTLYHLSHQGSPPDGKLLWRVVVKKLPWQNRKPRRSEIDGLALSLDSDRVDVFITASSVTLQLTLVLATQACPTLCNPMDCSPPGSPIPGILQQEYWSGLPFPSPMHACMQSRFSHVPTLGDPMDSSPPGSSVHGIL